MRYDYYFKCFDCAIASLTNGMSGASNDRTVRNTLTHQLGFPARATSSSNW